MVLLLNMFKAVSPALKMMPGYGLFNHLSCSNVAGHREPDLFGDPVEPLVKSSNLYSLTFRHLSKKVICNESNDTHCDNH
jgi:hypothetical protein